MDGVMANDTALLDRTSTDADEPSQEQEPVAETDELEDAAAVTGTDDEETENEDAEPLTEETFEKRLKAELAKKDESYRQKLEHERDVAAAKAEREAYESRKKEADAVRNGRAYQELATYVQWSLAEQKQIPAEWVKKTADSLGAMAFLEQHEAYVAQVDRFLKAEYPDYRLPKELATRVERAVTKHDPEAMVDAHQAILRDAIREDVRKELEAESRSKAQSKEIEERDERRATEPRPTRASGTGLGAGKPMVLTTAELNAYPVSRWMRDYTPEERQKVYANQEEANRKHGTGTVRAAVRQRWGS